MSGSAYIGSPHFNGVTLQYLLLVDSDREPKGVLSKRWHPQTHHNQGYNHQAPDHYPKTHHNHNYAETNHHHAANNHHNTFHHDDGTAGRGRNYRFGHRDDGQEEKIKTKEEILLYLRPTLFLFCHNCKILI